MKFIFILVFICGWLPQSGAQTVPTVEWYPPETEKSHVPERSKVVISGRTLPGSLVQIDGESVTIINDKIAAVADSNVQAAESIRQTRVSCKVYAAPDIKAKALASFQKGDLVKTMDFAEGWVKVFFKNGSGFMSRPCFVPVRERAKDSAQDSYKIENRSARANVEGFFELAIDLPEGRAQIPILVTSPTRTQKTFMISVNVSIYVNKVDEIKMNTKVTTSKPPAAAKKVRLWLGAGFTFQSYGESMTGMPDLKFQTIQAPGLVGRGGYWGDQWGVDFYFRDAPGKIEAEAPLQVQVDTYHWQTFEAKGLYQFSRGPSSRMGGRPSQWQLRFGAQQHQIPFLEVGSGSLVAIQESGVSVATLGIGLLLGQEQDWSYEFALGFQHPLSATGPGKSFSVSSPFGYEAQIGAAYKFAPNWRLGLFSYTQSLAYAFEYQNTNGDIKTGKQNLFYTTLDLRLGYEF